MLLKNTRVTVEKIIEQWLIEPEKKNLPWYYGSVDHQNKNINLNFFFASH